MKREFFEGNPDISRLILAGIPGDEFFKDYNINEGELLPYLPADKDQLRKVGTEVHYLSFYIKWDSQECYYYAVENTGFEPNTERTQGSYSKYSGIDDKIDPFHYFTTYIKFGLGRASYDASQEIRNDKITREEGIQLVKDYDSEFPNKYFKDFLNYINITKKEFDSIIDSFRSPHLWKLNKKKWELKTSVDKD